VLYFIYYCSYSTLLCNSKSPEALQQFLDVINSCTIQWYSNKVFGIVGLSAVMHDALRHIIHIETEQLQSLNFGNDYQTFTENFIDLTQRKFFHSDVVIKWFINVEDLSRFFFYSSTFLRLNNCTERK
jgi:hypothetical protein